MADILIKGIEMPENCKVCPFVCYENIYEKPYCPFLPYMKTNPKSRPSECPLVALPEHGDLMDYDVIANTIRTKIDDVPRNSDRTFSPRDGAYRDGLIRALGIVNNAPVVIPKSGS